VYIPSTILISCHPFRIGARLFRSSEDEDEDLMKMKTKTKERKNEDHFYSLSIKVRREKVQRRWTRTRERISWTVEKSAPAIA